MTDSIKVMDCPACSNTVSVQAEKCLSCGNPVEWTHPKILEFIDLKDSGFCDKEINFDYKAYKIFGGTSPELLVRQKVYFAIWFMLCLLLIIVFLPFYVGFIAGILAGVVYFIYTEGSGKKYTFEMDLSNDKWESTNDELFSRVREFFSKT